MFQLGIAEQDSIPRHACRHRSDATQRDLQVSRLRQLFPPELDGEPAVLAGDYYAVPDSKIVRSLRRDWRHSAARHRFLTSVANPPEGARRHLLSPWIQRSVLETRAIVNDLTPQLG